jgi:hypothetical protein
MMIADGPGRKRSQSFAQLPHWTPEVFSSFLTFFLSSSFGNTGECGKFMSFNLFGITKTKYKIFNSSGDMTANEDDANSASGKHLLTLLERLIDVM